MPGPVCPVPARQPAPAPSAERVVLRSLLRDPRVLNTAPLEQQSSHSLAKHVIPVFAASGGAGATTVSATLARAFSRQQERTIVVDGRRDSILPFYFGSRDGSHFGRAFTALRDVYDAPVHILTRDNSDNGEKSTDTAGDDLLRRGLTHFAGELDCALIDL